MSMRQDLPTDIQINPFPGLRPFSIDESHLFFGREGQTDEVLLKLAENRFVGIIGLSGSGKSSFVFCGVLPILYGGFFTDRGAEWDVVVMRPGASPVQNLAESLIKGREEYKKMDKEERVIQKTITSTLLKSSSMGLVEAVKQTGQASKKNFLILVDQFEELFRFSKEEENNYGSTQESLTFVNLLTEAVRSSEASIYVAITMRSDFIGDCAQFPVLTKMINDSHYLIPQMTREQKRDAILGPVAVAGGHISPRLVQQLLNDLGDKSDQLPILQHALMRTWDYWYKHKESDEPMDLHHYEAIGSMAQALSQHADEAYNELDDQQKVICEYIFKALTEKRDDSSGIRRPTKVRELALLCRVEEQEIIEVVEVFRKPGRSFLMPPYGTAITGETYIDISHESLMRIWDRLKIWVNEEAESISMYLRLADAASMYQIGKAGLWRPPDLQLALNWREKQQPTLTWGQRYHPAFERTMIFLEYSAREYEMEQKAKEEEQRQKIRRQRILTSVLSVAAIICLAFLLFALVQRQNAIYEKEVAEQALIEAQIARDSADIERRNAIEQTEIATSASMQAQVNAVKADSAAREALIEAERARLAQLEADTARLQAENNSELARLNALEASINANKAQISARRADSLRFLAIAKTLAAKSLTTDNNERDLKGLLAYQGYLFNKEKSANPRDPDIYSSLYEANKSFDMESGSPDAVTNQFLRGHRENISSLQVSPKSAAIFSASENGEIYRWNMRAQSSPTELYNGDMIINDMKVNNSISLIAAGGNRGEFLFLDPSTLEADTTLGVHENIIALDFQNEATVISAGSEGKIVRWTFGKSHEVILNLSIRISDVACHPVNERIYYADNAGQLRMIVNGKDSLVFRNSNEITVLQFSENGKYLAAGTRLGDLIIFNPVNMSIIDRIPSAHDDIIKDISFDWKNELIATASSDQTVKLWNLNNLNELPIVLSDHQNSFVFRVAFTSNNNFLLSGLTRGRVKVWSTNIEYYAEPICGKLSRNLSLDEWKRFVAEDVDYRRTCSALPPGEGAGATSLLRQNEND